MTHHTHRQITRDYSGKMAIANDNEIAAILASFRVKEESVIPVKKSPNRARRRRLTTRKYDRERRRERKGAMSGSQTSTPTRGKKRRQVEPVVPTEEAQFEVRWTDGCYYECRVIDFIQVGTRMYYDVMFVDDGIVMENVNASLVYPLGRKLPKRGAAVTYQ